MATGSGLIKDPSLRELGPHGGFEGGPGRRAAANQRRGAADCCEFCEVAAAVPEAVICRERAEGDRRFAFPSPFWAIAPTGISEKNRHLLLTMDCCDADKKELGKVCQISELRRACTRPRTGSENRWADLRTFEKDMRPIAISASHSVI